MLKRLLRLPEPRDAGPFPGGAACPGAPPRGPARGPSDAWWLWLSSMEHAPRGRP